MALTIIDWFPVECRSKIKVRYAILALDHNAIMRLN